MKRRIAAKIDQGGESGCYVPIVRPLRLVLKNIAASVALTCIGPKKRPKEITSVLYFGLSSQRL